MKKWCILIVLIFLVGCAGRDANPVASHQIGDDNRTCESLQLEISQNEVIIDKKLKKDSGKFLTNALWCAITPLAMDTKEAEKTEAEALQKRNNYLRILMNEKNCKGVSNTKKKLSDTN